MKRFIVLGHTAPVDPNFHLNDLPGGAGRIDVLCRAIGASLLVSHGIRRDVETMLLLRNARRIRVEGSRVKRLNPDERSTAALLRRALDTRPDQEIESTPGIHIRPSTLRATLDELVGQGGAPLVLDETGQPIDSFPLPPEPAFVLSDHLDFTDDEERQLAGFPRLSLGPTRLHTSQAITVVHHLLDRRHSRPDEELVLAHKVWGEPKAQMIVGLLEDFGIPANLVGHAPASVYPVAVDGLAEVRIMVRARDRDAARQIIADYFEPAES